MRPSNDERDRYVLSFTVGGLLEREIGVAAPVYLEVRDWGAVRSRVIEENLLQTRMASTAMRITRETIKRLAVLSGEEIELLVDSSPSERAVLLWIAACRQYAFIGEFAQEVVRERYLLMTPTLGYEQVDAFVNAKTLWHPELAQLKESTLKKLRQSLFTMLRQAGLLSDGKIQPVVLSARVRDALDAWSPGDTRFLPTPVPVEDAV